MASKRGICGALVLLFAVGSAHANGVPTLGDLDRVQGQIIMAEARRQLAEAQQALAKLQEADKADGAANVAPVVTGVYGTANDPYARFLLADGGQQVGRAGDLLPGSFKVVHVSVEKVIITDRRGRKHVARFSRTAPSAVESSAASGAPSAGSMNAPRPAGMP